jgi:hypothetical protein
MTDSPPAPPPSLLHPDIPALRLYRGALSLADCQDITTRFELDPRKAPGRAGIYGTVMPQKRTIDLQISGDDPTWKDADDKIASVITKTMRAYMADVPCFRVTFINGLTHPDTGYQLQRYLPNGRDGFDWHADAVPHHTRILAAIVYLNDVEKGGETEFDYHGKSVVVKPEAGAVLWFPCSFEYVHRGRTPESGPKYIATTFLVYNRVPHPETPPLPAAAAVQ